MRGVVLHRSKPIEQEPLDVEEVSVPPLDRDDVLVRVSVCGVCHTDLHVVEGDLMLPGIPLIPGHQVVGTVEQTGSGVDQFRSGDRVGVAWLHWACGECPFCRSGRENLCESGRFTGYHADGGYAQFTVVPADFAYHVPDNFSNVQAAPLLCGGVIGYRALRLSGAQPGQVVGLYGFGSSAHIVIQLARHMGCEVYVFTRSAEHQELARRLGAGWVGRAEERAPASLDSAIIFAPAGPLVPLALKALKPAGTLALAGITMTPIPEMPYELLHGERVVRTVANATRRDAQELLRLAAEVPVRTQVETFPLHEANRALCLLKDGRIDGSAVLTVP